MSFSASPATRAAAQGLAYRTLLGTMYDKDFPVILPEEAIEKKYLYIDTREMAEFEISHIADALWVGYDDFEMDRLQGVPLTQPLIVYCSVGARSQDIGKRLVAAGYREVYNLYGGLFHWVNEGWPVCNATGQTQEVHPYSPKWAIWLRKGVKRYE